MRGDAVCIRLRKTSCGEIYNGHGIYEVHTASTKKGETIL